MSPQGSVTDFFSDEIWADGDGLPKGLCPTPSTSLVIVIYDCKRAVFT